jgi:adenylate cyclase
MSPGLIKHRRTLAMICLAFTLTLAFLHLTEQRYAAAEQAGRDWLVSNGAAKRSPQNPRLVFLAIDDASKNLDTLFPEELAQSRALQLMKQGWPWNREVYALMIERLIGAGAKVIAFDMLFPSPREGDEAFHTALERYGSQVVIGANLKDIADDADASQSTVNKKPAYILPSRTLRPSGSMADPLIGFVNVKVDADQVARRVLFRTTLPEFFGTPAPPGIPELLSISARALEKAGFGVRVPPSHEPLLLRFSEEILPRSVHEIFVEAQWKAPPYNNGEFFRDKIVLIGAAGNEAEDRLRTPLGTVLAPMIHLSALNAALNRDFNHETSTPANLAFIAAGGLLAWALGAWVRRPLLRLGLLVAAIAGYYGTVQVLYNTIGLVPVLLSPLLALTASGITWSVWEQVLDRVERQRLRRTFERYVSKDVVRELLDNPQSYLNSLSGVRKEITVLFSDVRGFTSLTENADPHALVAQLNEYFEEMVGIVFANHGTLDKFIGDAVMAHWGSIVGEGAQTDAHRAVTTALQMRKALVRLNAGWKQRKMLELQFGIGVNHGEAIVGNLGCEAKMEVSVIGDAVNLGSRLEGATKQYHLDLCIGETAAALVRESFILRSVDFLVVKGKTRPVEIFTVLDRRDPGSAEPAWLALHEEAMQFYRSGAFSAAEKAWREVLERVPEDGIAEVFIERCVELQKHPPEIEWKGVYEMKSK